MSSEWCALVLLCFMLATRYGITFKSKCPDPEFYEADGDGGYGHLVKLSDRVREIIVDIGVDSLVAGSEFTVADVGKAFEASDRVDWGTTPGYVYYNLASDRFMPMPNTSWPYTREARGEETLTDTPKLYTPVTALKGTTPSGLHFVPGDPYAVKAAKASAAELPPLDPYRPESLAEPERARARASASASVHPKAPKVEARYQSGGSSGFRAGQTPSSPPSATAVAAAPPIRVLSREEKAFRNLQAAQQDRLGYGVRDFGTRGGVGW